MIRSPNKPATVHFLDGTVVYFQRVRFAYDDQNRPAFVWASQQFDGDENHAIPLSAIKMIVQ